MQDRFKFRAKRIDNTKFIEGYLCFVYIDNPNKAKIYCPDDCYNYDVYTETIAQCTGLKDKNGKLIFEGDLLKPLGEDDERVEIIWNEEKARFGLMIQWTDPCYWNGLYEETKTGRDYYDFDEYYAEDFEVIGNIYQDKELLNDSN